MGTIISQSEKAKRAVRWISEQRESLPEAKLAALVSEAGRRFDLTPAEEEGLLSFLRSGESAVAASEKARPAPKP